MPRRIVIAGIGGNGKTTLGRRLAHKLGVTFTELGALMHQPGWVPAETETFRLEVEVLHARLIDQLRDQVALQTAARMARSDRSATEFRDRASALAAQGRALARVPGTGLVWNAQDDFPELIADLEPLVRGGGLGQREDRIDDRHRAT